MKRPPFNEVVVLLAIACLLCLILLPPMLPGTSRRPYLFEVDLTQSEPVIVEMDRSDPRRDLPDGVFRIAVRGGEYYQDGLFGPLWQRHGVYISIYLSDGESLRVRSAIQAQELATSHPLPAAALESLERHFVDESRSEFLADGSLHFEPWRPYWPGWIFHLVMFLLPLIGLYWSILLVRESVGFVSRYRARRIQRHGPACASCGYSLNGLPQEQDTDPVCPECGGSITHPA
ncbi:MAG: hypothetical protein ACF8Q5_11015 [Phycisphaerales bacterium JB040]